MGSASVETKLQEGKHHEESKKEAILTHHVRVACGPLLICFALSLGLRISERSAS